MVSSASGRGYSPAKLLPSANRLAERDSQGVDRHGLVVIEDSCESLGSDYRGIKRGNRAYAHGAVFAFCPDKQITTGEGGWSSPTAKGCPPLSHGFGVSERYCVPWTPC